jgi:Protein of unknown function (DUF1425)
MSVRGVVLAIIFSVALGHNALAQSPPAPPPGPPPGQAPGQTIASKVQYAGTSRHLQITGLMMRMVNNLANLQIEVTNSDFDDQEGYYRIDWRDDAGFSVWDEEAWKPILLHGGQKRKIQAVAPTVKAHDFMIEFTGERNWSNAPQSAPQQ